MCFAFRELIAFQSSARLYRPCVRDFYHSVISILSFSLSLSLSLISSPILLLNFELSASRRPRDRAGKKRRDYYKSMPEGFAPPRETTEALNGLADRSCTFNCVKFETGRQSSRNLQIKRILRGPRFVAFNGYKRSVRLAELMRIRCIYFAYKTTRHKTLLPALLELICAGSHQEMDRWINVREGFSFPHT